nr:hypothetical protein [Tanacetum cinerariifolium]
MPFKEPSCHRQCNMRINPKLKPKEPTYQVVLDALALTTCYPAFFIIAEVSLNLQSHRKVKRNQIQPSHLRNLLPRKKYAKAKKVAATKPKPTKKKAPVKADRGKGLNVLSKVALSEAAQLKEVAKQSKKDFHISYASGSGDGIDFELGVPDEQHRKTSDDGDDNDNNDGDDDDDNDVNDDDNQEDNDKNDYEEEIDSDRTESDRIKIPVLDQSTMEYYKEEEKEKVDDEEKMDEEDDEITKELYKDVNVNLGNKDADMTDADQGGTGQQNVSQESGFEKVEKDAHVTL